MSSYCDCCASDRVYVEAHLLAPDGVRPGDDAEELADRLIALWKGEGEPLEIPRDRLVSLIEDCLRRGM